jgi:hypothetical protein
MPGTGSEDQTELDLATRMGRRNECRQDHRAEVQEVPIDGDVCGLISARKKF